MKASKDSFQTISNSAQKVWYWFNSGPAAPAFNMAMDEALLETGQRLHQPILRFYSWAEPAASFGYFQKYGEIEQLTRLRPLVRRPTAGGIVPHDADWTYSLSFPTMHQWYELSARESYCQVHNWIRQAFSKLGLNTELAPVQVKIAPGQCFVGHEQADLLWKGRKIAGAAQRRRKDGLLIQGSVQPPTASLKRADWESAMREIAQVAYGVEWKVLAQDVAIEKRAAELTQLKYSQQSYNQRR